MRELAASRATEQKVHRRCDVKLDVEEGSVVGLGVSQALAALEFVALHPVSGWWDTYVYNIVTRGLIMCRSICYLLLRHNAIDFCRGKFNNH